MSRRSATADWIGSDSPNKPDYLKTVWHGISGPHLRPMDSGDYLARNVKRARLFFQYGGFGPDSRPKQCVGPEHDH